MLDWQILLTYNKIAPQPFIVIPRSMSVELSEIDRLNTLDPLALTAIHKQYYPEVFQHQKSG